MAGRKPEGLGHAFSCRLREAQDFALRAEAKKAGVPLTEALRRWVDALQALAPAGFAPMPSAEIPGE